MAGWEGRGDGTLEMRMHMAHRRVDRINGTNLSNESAGPAMSIQGRRRPTSMFTGESHPDPDWAHTSAAPHFDTGRALDLPLFPQTTIPGISSPTTSSHFPLPREPWTKRCPC